MRTFILALLMMVLTGCVQHVEVPVGASADQGVISGIDYIPILRKNGVKEKMFCISLKNESLSWIFEINTDLNTKVSIGDSISRIMHENNEYEIKIYKRNGDYYHYLLSKQDRIIKNLKNTN